MRKGVFEVTAINNDPDQAAEVYGLIRNFVYFVVLYCTQCFFMRTVKALNRLRMCAV